MSLIIPKAGDFSFHGNRTAEGPDLNSFSGDFTFLDTIAIDCLAKPSAALGWDWGSANLRPPHVFAGKRVLD
jgi:hypothetical protein